MKILIATGIFPPDIGGPATYAKYLSEEFRRAGHQVRVATYGMEKRLPTGIRHLVYLMKSLPKIYWSEKILVLDTFSVGMPIALATLIFPRPYVIRVGGDFLWELYIERTHEALPIPDFYTARVLSKLTFKERTTFRLTKSLLHRAAKIAFTTPWLENIWVPVYGLQSRRSVIISNTLEHKNYQEARDKLFIWAGRRMFLKNLITLEKAFDLALKETPDIRVEYITGSKEELEEKLDKCYAVIAPSLSEVSPNLIHDAISHGKPFIVTKYNGLDSEIESLGLTVDPLSTTDIKDKIVIMSDKTGYKKMAQKLANFSKTRTWATVAQEFIRELKIANHDGK